MWNEPNCERFAFDTLKMLFGGDTLPVKVKFQQDAIVTRTPIIILSNKEVFPNDKAFNTRMFKYYWRSCPFLIRCEKKIMPLAIYGYMQDMIWEEMNSYTSEEEFHNLFDKE